MRYRLTSLADRDLDQIWVYIALDNPVAADRLIDLLHENFSVLTTQPRIGRACEVLGPGLYRFPVGAYVILYRLGPDHVEIARVFHGARDIEAILEGESK